MIKVPKRSPGSIAASREKKLRKKAEKAAAAAAAIGGVQLGDRSELNRVRQDNIRRHQELLAQQLRANAPGGEYGDVGGASLDYSAASHAGEAGGGYGEAPKQRFKLAQAAERKQLCAGEMEDAGGMSEATRHDADCIGELRGKRVAAVTEVVSAETVLIIVKTAVEDAEAIYNNVRAQIALPYHDDDGGDDDDDDDDWDKYLHFGDGDSDADADPNGVSAGVVVGHGHDRDEDDDEDEEEDFEDDDSDSDDYDDDSEDGDNDG